MMAMREAGELWLKDYQDDLGGPGNNDGASALDNIRDTCDGLAVKRWALGKAF